MKIDVFQPEVQMTLTVAEAVNLLNDLEDVNDSGIGPELSSSTVRLAGFLGATLEEKGMLPDDPDDDEPGAAVAQVINIFDKYETRATG